MAENMQIWFSFGLYLLFVTIPLIPAILIYKMFPNTQVGASGFLGNLKINATGAFAAYLITCILGFFIIRHIQGTIMNSFYQTWKVRGTIIYEDINGMMIKDQERLIQLTSIQVRPRILAKNTKYVKFLATGQNREIDICFVNSEPGFTSPTIDLSSINDSLKIDETNRTINIDTIIIKELKSITNTLEGPPITGG
jgi:hypothetical protein